jgi:hypothetical protein
VNFNFEYGITDQITFCVDLPYKSNFREKRWLGIWYEAHGFGDLTVKGRYWFAPPDLEGWNFYGEFGLTIPTGDDEAKTEFPGEPLKKPFIMPGQGQWTPQLSFGVLGQLDTDLAFSASMGYAWSLGESDIKYDAADVFAMGAGISYTAFKWDEDKMQAGATLFLMAVFINGKDEQDGVRIGNTGGRWIDLAPGFFFTPNEGATTVSLSIPFAVDFDVHFRQVHAKYSWVVSLVHRF